MSRRLDGTVALVTGASSGIGEATALELAAHGAAVVVVARRGDRLDELAGRVVVAGGQALALAADITDPEQGRSVVERAVAEFGRLDTVVNNAGVMLLGPARSAPLDEWERMVAINVSGLLHVTHAALPHLLAAAAQGPREVADLVMIGSVAGRRAGAGSSVYNLTKFGVAGMTEALRQEFAADHLRVSVVEPGAVASELREHLRPEIREAQAARNAGVEILESADVADAVAYLVTRPRRVAINEIVLRPTEQQG